MYKRFGKRMFDVLMAVTALLAAGPALGLIAFIVRMKVGRPIFFRQERPGLNGKLFLIFKLRTMTEGRDSKGGLLPDVKRLMPFGSFLRRTSLDELPEFLNVLRGEMSLVGPRPLLMDYLDRYSMFQARRMEVKPGITGWAQVNGRNALDWDTKFEHDVWYVDHLTFGLDMRILGMTMKKVLTKEGISYEGHATMPGFKGMGS
jgi:lipopolysaccharide/colanic/teichoic acid biosynthesis glycosyltransferase